LRRIETLLHAVVTYQNTFIDCFCLYHNVFVARSLDGALATARIFWTDSHNVKCLQSLNFMNSAENPTIGKGTRVASDPQVLAILENVIAFAG